MDVDLARTFLAVVETGSFLEAANRVFVTQSTVSARIRTLEERLGTRLFDRSKAGAAPTRAGLRFQKHAQAMVRIWSHARLESALPEGHEAALTIGAQYSLWDGFLVRWLAGMRRDAPEFAMRAQMGFSDSLMQGLIDGVLDLGVMYTPQGRPGFQVEMLFEDEIVLVSGNPQDRGGPGENYVLIDWGPEFRADHALNFPDISMPGTYLELGSLSLQYLAETGASGYVPRRLLSPDGAAESLRPVPGAPVFSYPAYVVYPDDAELEIVHSLLTHMRDAARRLVA